MDIWQKYIWPALLIIVCVAVIVVAFIILGKQAEEITRSLNYEQQSQTPSQPEIKITKIEIYKESGPSGKVLKLVWENLPNGTSRLKIFRSKIGTTQWILWKTEDLSQKNLASGSVDIKLGRTETTDGYVFYVQAIGGEGAGGTTSTEVLWTSSSTPALTPPVVPPPPAGIVPPPGDNGNQVTTTPPIQIIPAPPIATSSYVAPTSTPATTTIYYYTPDGNISGAQIQNTSDFWVQHVNRAIEIGWQNISGADKITVSRSLNQTGDWNAILNQNDPTSSYYIRLIDETIFTDYYYKMDIYSGENITKTIGPILLPALQ